MTYFCTPQALSQPSLDQRELHDDSIFIKRWERKDSTLWAVVNQGALPRGLCKNHSFPSFFLMATPPPDNVENIANNNLRKQRFKKMSQ